MIAAATGLAVGGLVAGAAISTVLLPFQAMQFYLMGGANWRRVKVRLDDGRAVVLKRHLGMLPGRLRPAGGDGMGFRIEVEIYSLRKGTERFRIEGEAATRAAAAMLAAANAYGGTQATVQDAVGRIEAMGSAESVIADLAAANDFKDGVGRPGLIMKMPEPTRLALEMALHEEQERRALEGELWLLEQAWRDAEEIAAISDDLLLPEGAGDFVRERGRKGDGRRAS